MARLLIASSLLAGCTTTTTANLPMERLYDGRVLVVWMLPGDVRQACRSVERVVIDGNGLATVTGAVGCFGNGIIVCSAGDRECLRHERCHAEAWLTKTPDRCHVTIGPR